MNTALDFYQHDKQVKQVSGFLFPANIPRQHRAMLMPLANTIGWGTWERAWNEVDLKAPGHEALLVDEGLRRRFNLNNTYDYSKMLARQMASAQFGSWGVIYWWSIFRNNGLVVYPDYSLIQHNDFDHSGVHASDDSHYNHRVWDEAYTVTSFPDVAAGLSQEAFDLVCSHLRRRSSFSFQNIKIKVNTLFHQLMR